MPEITPADVAALKESVFSSNKGTAPIASVGTNERPNTVVQPTEQIQAPAAPADTPKDTPTEPVFDKIKFIKENFGYDSDDLLKQDLENYGKLKSAPPSQLTFPDESSKTYYDYLQNGKEDDLLSSLEARRMLRNVDTLNDEQKLKMYIKMTNPLYDQELVDDEYNSLYGIQEDKFKDSDGNIADQIGFRKAKVKAEQQRMNDVTKANEHFSKFKSKINLPKIEAPVDEKYADFQKFSEDANRSYDKLVQASKSIKPEDVPLNFKFADEASKLNIDANIQMDKEGFDKALSTVLSYAIIDDSYKSEDGSPLIANMVKDVYFNQNRDKVVAEIIVQAVNAERTRYLASQKNFTETGRSLVPNSPSPVDNLRQQVFGK